jgi:hypothetical protein
VPSACSRSWKCGDLGCLNCGRAYAEITIAIFWRVASEGLWMGVHGCGRAYSLMLLLCVGIAPFGLLVVA